jgi:hypothetical protein
MEKTESSCTEKGRIVLFDDNENTVCVWGKVNAILFGDIGRMILIGENEVFRIILSVSNFQTEFLQGIALDKRRNFLVRDLLLTV